MSDAKCCVAIFIRCTKGYYNGVVSPLQYMQASGTLTEQLARKIGSESEILRYQYFFLISYYVFTVGI